MSDRLILATRKGLLTLARRNGSWRITATEFPGIPITAVLRDPRDGTIYAALKHGHFGTKLHRSDDDGKSFTELAAPAFPADAAGQPSLFQVWTLETGGTDELGALWAGAIPAGLFRSDDRGGSWRLVDALWNVPERAKWFGGGYDDAGIHTVSPDPRDSETGVRRDFVRRGLGNQRRRRKLGAARQRHDRGLHAARAGPRTRSAGPAPRRALRGGARHDVDAAPQRHFPFNRRRRDLEPAQAAGRRFRLCGCGASA